MELPPPLPPADPLNSPIARRLSAICLILIVVIGAWLRGVQIDEPLWVDELHTSWVVADGLLDIPARAAAGNQSPPFFFAVWGSTRLVGHSEWGLRLPSLLAGVALIAFSFAYGRRWSGSRAAGLLIAMLVAVNHECILFANEARPYAWLQLFSLLHAGVFVRVLTRPSPGWRVLLVLGAIWLFYLHYTAALFLLAEAGCYGLLRLFCPDKVHYRPKQWLVDWIVVFVLVLPSFPHLAAIAQRRENWERFVRLVPSPGVRNSFWLYVIAPLAGLGISRLLRRPLSTTTTTSLLWIWVACWLSHTAGGCLDGDTDWRRRAVDVALLCRFSCRSDHPGGTTVGQVSFQRLSLDRRILAGCGRHLCQRDCVAMEIRRSDRGRPQ